MFDITFDHIYQFNHKKGSVVPDHSHNNYEFCYYVAGSGSTRLDGVDAVYNSADYAVYCPGVTHQETHDCNATVLCLTFFLNSQEDFSIQSGVYHDTDKLILEKLERIGDEYADKRPGHITMIELLIAEMLICYNRQRDQKAFQADEISRIRAFLDVNFANEIRMEELVKSSGYSYHHFRHIFKSKIGDSPKGYVMRKRLEYARNMLVTSDASISKIALISGFSTSSQFSSIFKKHTGMSPSQYRLSHTKHP